MNNRFRRALAFVLLMAVAFSLCSCKKEPTVDELWRSLADQDEVAELASMVTGNLYKGEEAAKRGDSYCKKCDKFIEGKVRICTYCGQYL